jgi:methionyl aminopeptidase
MGRIIIKSARDLEKMRAAGLIVSTVLAAVRAAVRPGVSTRELDRLALELIRARGGSPSFLGYQGYPASICSSVNEEVVHGIPSESRILRAGDIIKVDVGVRLNGFHADSAITVPVGPVPDEVQRLLQATREALWAGICAVTRRGTLRDVSHAIQDYVERHGFAIVRSMVGHGVGKRLHEAPPIPNYVDPQHPNPRLRDGMTLAIEPMVTAGGAEVETLPDKWTVVTADRSLSAHFEHTVAVTRHGFDVLTLGPHDPGR